jgi:hypothetical protein
LRNMKAKISNTVNTLIAFSIYVGDNESYLLSKFNAIQPSITKMSRNHSDIFES